MIVRAAAPPMDPAPPVMMKALPESCIMVILLMTVASSGKRHDQCTVMHISRSVHPCLYIYISSEHLSPKTGFVRWLLSDDAIRLIPRAKPMVSFLGCPTRSLHETGHTDYQEVHTLPRVHLRSSKDLTKISTSTNRQDDSFRLRRSFFLGYRHRVPWYARETYSGKEI